MSSGGDDGSAQDADSLDFDLDDLAGLQEDRRCARRSDAARRSGADDVASIQGHRLIGECADASDAEQHVGRGTVLHHLSIDPGEEA